MNIKAKRRRAETYTYVNGAGETYKCVSVDGGSIQVGCRSFRTAPVCSCEGVVFGACDAGHFQDGPFLNVQLPERSDRFTPDANGVLPARVRHFEKDAVGEAERRVEVRWGAHQLHFHLERVGLQGEKTKRICKNIDVMFRLIVQTCNRKERMNACPGKSDVALDCYRRRVFAAYGILPCA